MREAVSSINFNFHFHTAPDGAFQSAVLAKLGEIMDTQESQVALLEAANAALEAQTVALGAVTAIIEKVGAETDGLAVSIQTLKDIIAGQGSNASPELVAVAAKLSASVAAISASVEAASTEIGKVDAKVDDASGDPVTP